MVTGRHHASRRPGDRLPVRALPAEETGRCWGRQLSSKYSGPFPSAAPARTLEQRREACTAAPSLPLASEAPRPRYVTEEGVGSKGSPTGDRLWASFLSHIPSLPSRLPCNYGNRRARDSFGLCLLGGCLLITPFSRSGRGGWVTNSTVSV